MTTTSVKLWRYVLPSVRGEGWAVFVLGSDGFFSAVSDFGNYAYLWRAHGCADFRQFLLGAARDWSYFANKLSEGEREYDGTATRRGIQRHILEYRRDRTLSKEEARREWDLCGSDVEDYGHGGGFADWYRETALPDAAFFAVYRIPKQAEMFVKKTLAARLVPLLEAELRAEGKLVEGEKTA